jgi:anti-sigma factor RsiW
VSNHECDIAPLLGPYEDNELSPDKRREVEAHLETCTTCRSELADMRKLSSALRAAVRPAAPPNFAERIEDAAFAPKSLPIQRHVRAVRWLTALAATVFLVAVGRLGYMRFIAPGTSSHPGDVTPAGDPSTRQNQQSPAPNYVLPTSGPTNDSR